MRRRRHHGFHGATCQRYTRTQRGVVGALIGGTALGIAGYFVGSYFDTSTASDWFSTHRPGVGLIAGATVGAAAGAAVSARKPQCGHA